MYNVHAKVIELKGTRISMDKFFIKAFVIVIGEGLFVYERMIEE